MVRAMPPTPPPDPPLCAAAPSGPSPGPRIVSGRRRPLRRRRWARTSARGRGDLRYERLALDVRGDDPGHRERLVAEPDAGLDRRVLLLEALGGGVRPAGARDPAT